MRGNETVVDSLIFY